MILCLDLATKTGVAKGTPGEMPSVETWRLPAALGDSGPLLAAFRRQMDAALEGVTTVVIEAFWTGGNKGGVNPYVAQVLCPLRGLVQLYVHDRSARGMKWIDYTPAELKSRFAGTGRANKADMVAAAERRGFKVDNDNEADACALFYVFTCDFHSELAGAYDPLFRRR